jgi:Spy/CpxP family protein refolding chaperone
MATWESDANQISWIEVFPGKKGVSMRIVTASVIIAALSLGTPAFVQAQGAPSQSEAQPPQSSQSSTVIRSIQVVDIKDLQPAVRSKVDELMANTREEDIQSLRKSIDATPEAAAVLKAKGLSSSQVVAINIADGVLTMFAKTA